MYSMLLYYTARITASICREASEQESPASRAGQGLVALVEHRHPRDGLVSMSTTLQWWESTTTLEERDTIPIQVFWERFGRKYFPPIVQTEMRRKLLNLKQENSTVTEYEEEFTRLLTIVPDEAPTEGKKILLFVDGLAWRIRQHLIGNLSLSTFTNVLNAALLHC